MSRQFSSDFLINVQKGLVPKHSMVHKFGSGDLTTTISPLTRTGLYETPAAVVSLEFVSSSANDTSAGSGAREIIIQGLDASYNEVSQTLVTNGLTAVALTTDLLRLHRWYVSSSGTYATATAGSHAGDLSIQTIGGGTVWSQILTAPSPMGQSQIGSYSIPIGHTGYLLSKSLFTDTGKTADIYFYKRDNINDVVVPYSGTIRIVEEDIGVTGGYNVTPRGPKKGFVGPCDVGFMGKVSTGTARASCEFELLLVQD